MNGKITIRTDEGVMVEAVAPVIVSASRATDIPAFYIDWLMRRLKRGYVMWRNPRNGIPSYVSFKRTRFIVFWSKNPEPLLPHIPTLKAMGIGCYVHYTLNDYVAESLEPYLPPLSRRVDSFKRLSDALGPDGVVWRFDPLMLTDKIDTSRLLDKVGGIAECVGGYTRRLVFSYADIGQYHRVARNLIACGVRYIEWREEPMVEFATKLAALNAARWRLSLSTCAESVDLSHIGIQHNRCVDPDLIRRMAPHDLELHNYLFGATTDKGQRKLCGCVTSKDIGQYDTCPHGCVYCYANASPLSATANHRAAQSSPYATGDIISHRAYHTSPCRPSSHTSAATSSTPRRQLSTPR